MLYITNKHLYTPFQKLFYELHWHTFHYVTLIAVLSYRYLGEKQFK